MNLRHWLASVRANRSSARPRRQQRSRGRRDLWIPSVERLEARILLSSTVPGTLGELTIDLSSVTLQAGETASTTSFADVNVPELVDAGDYYWSEAGQVSLDRIVDEVIVQLKSAAESLLDEASSWQVVESFGEDTVHLRRETASGTLELPPEGDSWDDLPFSATEVEWVSPVLFNEQSQTRVFPTNEIIVDLQEGQQASEVLTEAAGFTSYQRILGTPDQFVVTVEGDGLDALRIANELHTSGVFDCASPNARFEVQSQSVNDTLYPQQWHLNNTGQLSGISDADSDVVEAWTGETGDSSVVIAVFDDGMDMTHPDLVDNIFVNAGEIAGNGIDDDGNGWIDDRSGLDFSPTETGTLDYDADPSHNTAFEAHGTAVAGVAAAVGNNGAGVSGAAQHAKILPIKMMSDSGSGGSFSPSRLISALRYAAGFNSAGTATTWRGADIQNHSWGANAGSPGATVDAAFNTAATSGRGGLGSPIFVATGNDANGSNSSSWFNYSVGDITGAYASTWAWIVGYEKDGATSVGEDAVRIVDFVNGDGVTHRFNSLTPPGFNLNPSFLTHSGWVVEDNPARAYGTSRYQLKNATIGDNGDAYFMAPSFIETTSTISGFSFRAMRSTDPNDEVVLKLRDVTNGITYDLGPSGTVAKFNDLPNATFTTGIGYPASLASTIAVGASTDFDFRSDYSQYSSAIDFVAPSNGGLNGIRTTDRQGTAGYNTATTASGGDYDLDFGGTSSATPFAAGISALLLSKNPNLTAAQVRQIMRDSADKIGGVTYTSGFNDYYGYGRVNAAAALAMVTAAPGIRIDQSAGVPAVYEHGDSTRKHDTFAVSLATAPTSNVVLNVSGNDMTEVSVSASSLTFTPANWNIAQTITVSGVFDAQADGMQKSLINVSVNDALSDNVYDPVADESATVTVNDVPLQVTLTGPTGGGQSSQPTITWNSVAGASAYYLYVINRDSGSLAYETGAISSGATSFQIPTPLAAGDYRFWLTALGTPSDSYAPFGSHMDFSVGAAAVVPTAPAVSGTSGAANQPQFNWPAPSGATRYSVYLINLGTGALVASQSGLTSPNFTPSSTLADGTYRLWVNAANGAGSSTWSTPFDYTVGAPVTVPTVPVVTGTTDTGNPLRPQINWNASTGGGTINYTVFLINRQTGALIASQSVGTATSFQPASNLTDNSAYRIWVYASNVAGASSWSAPFDFLTGVSTPPAVPTGLSVTNTGTTTPTVDWADSVSATSYEIYFINLDNGAFLASTTLGTSQYTTAPLTNGRYRIWVKSKNAVGSSNWSGPFDFTVSV